MSEEEQPVKKTKVEARQADRQGGTRRVLYISTVLAILVLAIALWLIS